MAHPMNEHRAHKVSKNRVAHITHGEARAEAEGEPVPRRATGGAVKAPLRADGGSVKARADKVARAKGGRVKGTTVNVIVAPKGQDTPAPMAAMPPPMPPKPPMPAPAPAAMGPSPVAGLGGMPPMPPRSDGGRAYKKGGAVKGKMSGEKKHGKGKFKMRWAGGAISDSSEGKTEVQHSGNKSDTQNIGRGKVITRATGGPIYADGRKGKQMSWNKGPAGGGGGLERIAAAKRRKSAGHEPWTSDPAK